MAEKTVKFTRNQQAAIDVATSNILVSAAAGSGKTAVLTQRVKRLLTGADAIPANRLVIVTFTVAAAQEMRRRISESIADLIEEDPLNLHLLSQQLLISSAKICTIHSLCSSLIRDNFQKLSLSPDFRVADETELLAVKKEAMDDVLEQLYTLGEDDFLHLAELFCTKNDKRLTAIIMTIYDFIRSFSFPQQFLDTCEKMYSENADTMWENDILAHAKEALEYALLQLGEALDKIADDEAVKGAYAQALEYDLLQMTHLLDAVKADEWDKSVTLCKGYQRLPFKAVRGYDDKAFLEEIKAHRKLATDIIDSLSVKYLSCTKASLAADYHTLRPVIHTLFLTVNQVYEKIEELKTSRGIIDYADLEHYALRLLLDTNADGEHKKSALAYELADTIDEIMVDECQDINEVQNTIFTLLSKDEHNIFMVGDVKQSIYRFRKAMPALFIQKRRVFPLYDEDNISDCATIILENNFRSRTQVCDTVNHVFSRIMSARMGEIEYNNEEELVASASYADNDKAYSEVHILDNNSDIDSTTAEGQYIAKLIQDHVLSGYAVEEQGHARPCRYGDFAILLRAVKGKSGVLIDQLKAYDIPCYADATDGYFNEYEIAVTLNLLRVIDNPLQDICIASVLMSPMFGFTADMITQVRLKSPSSALFLAITEWEDNPHCVQFSTSLEALRQKAAVSMVDELVQDIYDQTDFVSLVYAMGNGQQRDANLRLLLSYAKKYEAIGTGGLSGFLRYIDKIISGNGDFSCANTGATGNDTVKIMSIHSSKGLEFPITIVADCAKGFNKMDLNQSYQLNYRRGFGMKIVEKDSLKKYSNLPFEAIRLATSKETISEEMRILYVAMTRAREKLIMVMTIKEPHNRIGELSGGSSKLSPFAVFSAKSFADWLIMALNPNCRTLEANGVCEIGSYCKVVVAKAITAISHKAQQSIAHDAPCDVQILETLQKNINFVYKDKELTSIPAKVTATQMSRTQEVGVVNLKLAPSFLSEQGLTPAQRGTILHSFMQYADFAAAKLDLHTELERLIQLKFLSVSDVAALDTKKILGFLSSDLYKQMEQADELLREYKFIHFIKAGDVDSTLQEPYASHEVMLQGIADCLIIKNSAVTIVDYKTDVTADINLLVQRYENQLNIYKQAIAPALALPVVECKLYSLHLQREITV